MDQVRNYSDHALDRMYDTLDQYIANPDRVAMQVALNQMAETITSLKTELDSLWHIMTEASRRSQARQEQAQVASFLTGKGMGEEHKHGDRMVDSAHGKGQYL